MKAAVLVASITIVAVSSPAAARNYYVVQNLKTHHCYVLPKKPKTKTVVLVSGSTAYKTRAEARAAIGTFASCKT